MNGYLDFQRGISFIVLRGFQSSFFFFFSYVMRILLSMKFWITIVADAMHREGHMLQKASVFVGLLHDWGGVDRLFS